MTKEKIGLDVIEAAATKVLNQIFHIELPDGIRTPWKNWEVTLCRQFYYKIAVECGHRPARAAQHIGFSEESCYQVLAKIESKIKKYEKIYNQIKEEVSAASRNESDVRSTA